MGHTKLHKLPDGLTTSSTGSTHKPICTDLCPVAHLPMANLCNKPADNTSYIWMYAYKNILI